MTSAAPSSYYDALEYLQSFINWEVERHVRYSPEAMALGRIRQVLEALGNPHQQYPVIHVTGTKGKGSVGALCSSALQHSGLRTGLYSSPHLQDYRERFRINGVLISPEEFAGLVDELRPHADAVPEITWFEVTTALAFLYFARSALDVAVIEVGLGGRLDATNVVTPVVSVITSLSYDHTHLLGDSLESIAAEKAGIIKPGVPVVSAPQPSEALAVLESTAAERNAPLTVIGRDWLYELERGDPSGEAFWSGPVGEPPARYRTALLGEHQALNAAVAHAALYHVQRAGIPLTAEGVATGFAKVDWPGRLEVVHREPLLVLDAAHNAASAMRLREVVEERFPQRPLVLVFGASADKDVAGMFDALLPICDALVTCQAAHPRALAPDALVAAAQGRGFARRIVIAPDVRSALRFAANLSGSAGAVCVTGSLFVVGEVRSIFGLPPGHVVSQPLTAMLPGIGD